MTRERSRIVRLGRAVFERTDPDYNDKRLAQLAKDYAALPKKWRDVFLAGLEAADRKELRERRTKA